jgi:O-antigen/teichoic acid export membrane protein
MPADNPVSLKKRAFSAARWTIVGFALGQALRLGSTLVMTRLLVPEMFGVMAIATIVTILINLLSDIGLRQSIIQSSHGDSPEFLDTAWILQIARGVGCWILALLVCLGFFTANIFGLFPERSVYAVPILPWVVMATSFSAVILGFESTRIATAHRKFDQRRWVQIELIGQLVALIVMVVTGFLTRSIWALVAGGLVSSLTTTLLSHTWMQGHANRFHWDSKSAKEIIQFGRWIFASSALFVFVSIGDRMLLGFFVEPGTLGLYSIAAQIISAIQAGPTKLFSAVTLPALSEIARNDHHRLREIYYRNRVPVDIALLFLMGFVAATANLIIDLLYDHRYAGAGDMLGILAFSLFAVRFGVASQIHLAIGMANYVAITSAVRVVALYGLVPVLYYIGGEQAVIWGIALHAVTTVPIFFYLNAKHKLNDWLRETTVLLAIPAGYILGVAVERFWH